MSREAKKLKRQEVNERRKGLAAQAQAVSKSLPTAGDPDRNWYQQQFKWSGRYIDHEHSAGWDWNLAPKEAKEILCLLEEMSAKTWAEIAQETVGAKGRARSHAQSLTDVVQGARDRLGALQIEAEELYRVRMSFSGRLWGYRIRGVFYLLWFDRDHEIYAD